MLIAPLIEAFGATPSWKAPMKISAKVESQPYLSPRYPHTGSRLTACNAGSRRVVRWTENTSRGSIGRSVTE